MRFIERAFEGDRQTRALGALALLFLTLHAARHVRTGELVNLLWLSNLATLVLAISCCVGRSRWPGVALLWLSLSALLWVADILARPSALDTALLTHVGSFGVALAAVRRVGLAPGSWCIAAGGLVALVGLSRAATEPRYNVNLAFAVADGWGSRFPSHAVYLASLFLLASALFFVVERVSLLARLAPRRIE